MADFRKIMKYQISYPSSWSQLFHGDGQTYSSDSRFSPIFRKLLQTFSAETGHVSWSPALLTRTEWCKIHYASDNTR